LTKYQRMPIGENPISDETRIMFKAIRNRVSTVWTARQASEAMSQRREKQIVISMIIAYIALALVFSLGPIFEGPDEIEHYRYIRILARTRTFPDPVSQPEGQLFQPPLYYALASPLSLLIDDADFDEIDGRRNPYHGYLIGIPSNDNKNVYLHTRAEAFPYRESGVARDVHLIRLLSVAIGTCTLIVSYAVFRLLWPERPDRRLAALGFVAFWPTFVFVSSVVTNDILVYLLTTLSLFLLLRQQRHGYSWGNAALLGVVLGAALLTELSAGLLVFPVGVATLMDRGSWRYAPLTLGVTLLVAGWWYVRNTALYGDPLGLEALYATWPSDVIQAGGKPSFQAALTQLPYAFPGFWARFGYGSVVVGKTIYYFFGALTITTLLGFIVWLIGSVRTVRWKAAGPTATRQAIIVGTIALAWTGGAVLHASQVYTGNTGRQFLPVVAAWGALLSLGTGQWTPRRLRVPVALGGVALMAVVAVVSLFGYFLPAYKVQSAPATIEYPLAYRYDDVAELIGVEPETTYAQPGQTVRITLYWRALRPTDSDLQTYLHSLDSNVIRHDSLPGGGNLLSTDWLPGETWSETNVIVIPSEAEAQVAYPLIAGLYDPETGSALPANDSDGNVVTPTVGRIAINGRAEPFAPAYRFGDVIGMAEPRITRRDGELDVCQKWVSLAPTPVDYTVFVHVLAGDGEKLTQADFEPKDGRYPTGAWTPGETIEDCVTLDLPDMPETEWQVAIGVYERVSGHRLAAQDAEGQSLQDNTLLIPASDS
jgi:4-amino-4-deoxy-L-arabinose transferase-like glycosyltransferase